MPLGFWHQGLVELQAYPAHQGYRPLQRLLCLPQHLSTAPRGLRPSWLDKPEWPGSQSLCVRHHRNLPPAEVIRTPSWLSLPLGHLHQDRIRHRGVHRRCLGFRHRQRQRRVWHLLAVLLPQPVSHPQPPFQTPFSRRRTSRLHPSLPTRSPEHRWARPDRAPEASIRSW